MREDTPDVMSGTSNSAPLVLGSLKRTKLPRGTFLPPRRGRKFQIPAQLPQLPPNFLRQRHNGAQRTQLPPTGTMSAPAGAGANEDDPLDWSDTSTTYMRDGSYEEARWNRVLIQTGAGLALFLLVLVATRAWTSYVMTWRVKPNRHYPKQFDVVIGVVDIIASVGSLCCFIARTYIRVSNPGLRWFEVCMALFYFLAMWRRLWLKNFDVGVAFTMSTFLAGPPPLPAPSPLDRTVPPVYPRTLAASSSLA